MLKSTFTIVMLALICATSNAQNYTPSPENLANREWFQDAKFGMFIHWGIYSVLGEHEWVMETRKIDKPTYEKIAPFFNPVDFNAEEWVLLAKSSGMKYITITAKHHDGFAMFDSKLTDWDIVDRTHYHKDVLQQMAAACRKHGLKLFFYYSQLDWNNTDYFPRGGTGNSTARPQQGDWQKYLDFMNGQLTELLTNYGDIAGIWFDGWWDKKNANWDINKTYETIHNLQPQAMIGSNHHLTPNPGEDFQMFEKDLPGQNKGGFSKDAEIGKLPLETAETMAERWGFSLQDKNYKTTKELILYLVKAAGHNCNFLLNVGPMPNGKIQPEFIDTLANVGQWINKYGNTIYGTRGGPFSPQPWGVSTQKGNTVYLHLLDYNLPTFYLPLIDKNIKKIIYLDSKKEISFEKSKFGYLFPITVDNSLYDNVLEITLDN